MSEKKLQGMERNEFRCTEKMETELTALSGRPHFPPALSFPRDGWVPLMTLSPGFPFWRLTAISHNLLYRNPFFSTALFKTTPILETAGA